MIDRFSGLGYVVNPLDRRAELRDRAEVIDALRSEDAARAIVLAGDGSVLNRKGDGLDALFSLQEAAAFGEARETVFLGVQGEGAVFGIEIDAALAEPLGTRPDLLVTDARSIAVQALVPPDEIGILAEAKALLHWHRRHRFCSVCGAPTSARGGGWKRVCASCSAEHFPRTDPVVIMLTVLGDRCVLGRQSRFPPGMYSCLAGFLEPGETIEAAVRRETSEEAGVRTGRVRYLASQPWPFPASLMIGCLAEALNDDLTVDGEELEHARWFTRDEVRLMLEGKHPDGLLAPQPMAIANAILRAWALDGETP
jgi:NAD+ diphosphatase